jgi:DNA-binding NarL/FixJ family response regulator
LFNIFDRMAQIHLSIIEDEALVRESLSEFLSAQAEFKIHSIAESVETFLAIQKADAPQILLLDINLPGISGLEGIDLLQKKYPKMEIIMLTSYEEEEHVFEALRRGAVGYLSKRSSLLMVQEAIQTVAEGGSFMSPSIARHVVNFFRFRQRVNNPDVELTKRQKEILRELVDGKSYKMIADVCGITLETVRDHIKKIYKKLHINSRGELVSMLLDKRI